MFLNLFTSHREKRLKKYLLILSVAFVSLCLFIFLLYRHFSAAPYSSQPKLSQEQAQTQALLDEVAKIMALPNNETPMVATVLDKNKVQGQAFFAGAENGDKLIAYLKSKTAILYRPSLHKIIEVAPITLDTSLTTSTPTK